MRPFKKNNYAIGKNIYFLEKMYRNDFVSCSWSNGEKVFYSKCFGAGLMLTSKGYEKMRGSLKSEKNMQEQKTPAISVIIPIYNQEPWLIDCLESIRVQTFSNFEVLMIDDGSTDNSARIAKSYAEKDARFLYLYQENGGVSSARNLGISHARGTYVAFVDADDMVVPNYLEWLYKPTTKAPYVLVLMGVQMMHNGTVFATLEPKGNAFTALEFQRVVLCRQIQMVLFLMGCAKMYLRRFLEENTLLFSKEFDISEDGLFNTQALAKMRDGDSVCVVQQAGYRYIKHENSATTKRSFTKMSQAIRANTETLKLRKQIVEMQGLGEDIAVREGIQTAFALCWLSNAEWTETNVFSAAQRAELYNLYLPDVREDISEILHTRSPWEQKILRYTMKKDARGIHRAYKMRAWKNKIRRLFPL